MLELVKLELDPNAELGIVVSGQQRPQIKDVRYNTQSFGRAEPADVISSVNGIDCSQSSAEAFVSVLAEQRKHAIARGSRLTIEMLRETNPKQNALRASTAHMSGVAAQYLIEHRYTEGSAAAVPLLPAIPASHDRQNRRSKSPTSTRATARRNAVQSADVVRSKTPSEKPWRLGRPTPSRTATKRTDGMVVEWGRGRSSPSPSPSTSPQPSSSAGETSGQPGDNSEPVQQHTVSSAAVYSPGSGQAALELLERTDDAYAVYSARKPDRHASGAAAGSSTAQRVGRDTAAAIRRSPSPVERNDSQAYSRDDGRVPRSAAKGAAALAVDLPRLRLRHGDILLDGGQQAQTGQPTQAQSAVSQQAAAALADAGRLRLNIRMHQLLALAQSLEPQEPQHGQDDSRQQQAGQQPYADVVQELNGVRAQLGLSPYQPSQRRHSISGRLAGASGSVGEGHSAAATLGGVDTTAGNVATGLSASAIHGGPAVGSSGLGHSQAPWAGHMTMGMATAPLPAGVLSPSAMDATRRTPLRTTAVVSNGQTYGATAPHGVAGGRDGHQQDTLGLGFDDAETRATGRAGQGTARDPAFQQAQGGETVGNNTVSAAVFGSDAIPSHLVEYEAKLRYLEAQMQLENQRLRKREDLLGEVASRIMMKEQGLKDEVARQQQQLALQFDGSGAGAVSQAAPSQVLLIPHTGSTVTVASGYNVQHVAQGAAGQAGYGMQAPAPQAQAMPGPVPHLLAVPVPIGVGYGSAGAATAQLQALQYGYGQQQHAATCTAMGTAVGGSGDASQWAGALGAHTTAEGQPASGRSPRLELLGRHQAQQVQHMDGALVVQSAASVSNPSLQAFLSSHASHFPHMGPGTSTVAPHDRGRLDLAVEARSRSPQKSSTKGADRTGGQSYGFGASLSTVSTVGQMPTNGVHGGQPAPIVGTSAGTRVAPAAAPGPVPRSTRINYESIMRSFAQAEAARNIPMIGYDGMMMDGTSPLPQAVMQGQVMPMGAPQSTLASSSSTSTTGSSTIPYGAFVDRAAGQAAPMASVPGLALQVPMVPAGLVVAEARRRRASLQPHDRPTQLPYEAQVSIQALAKAREREAGGYGYEGSMSGSFLSQPASGVRAASGRRPSLSGLDGGQYRPTGPGYGPHDDFGPESLPEMGMAQAGLGADAPSVAVPLIIRPVSPVGAPSGVNRGLRGSLASQQSGWIIKPRGSPQGVGSGARGLPGSDAVPEMAAAMGAIEAAAAASRAAAAAAARAASLSTNAAVSQGRMFGHGSSGMGGASVGMPAAPPTAPVSAPAQPVQAPASTLRGTGPSRLSAAQTAGAAPLMMQSAPAAQPQAAGRASRPSRPERPAGPRA